MLPIVLGLGWGIKKLVGGVGGAISGGIGDVLSGIAKGIATAVGNVLQTLATAWVHIDVPNVWNGATSGTVAELQAQVAWLAGLLAVVGLIIGGVKLAMQSRVEPGIDVAHGLVVLVLVTGMGTATLGLLASAADAWSQSIVSSGTSATDFGRNMLLLVAPAGTFGPVLLILFGIVALLLSLAQIVFLAFRAGVLVLIAGLLPLTASMATTRAGRRQFQRVVAWALAFIAYKPLAALIYHTAFRLTGTHQLSSGGIGSILIGLTMMLAALLAMPALVRLCVPAVNAVADLGAARQVHPGAAPTGAVAVHTVKKVMI